MVYGWSTDLPATLAVKHPKIPKASQREIAEFVRERQAECSETHHLQAVEAVRGYEFHAHLQHRKALLESQLRGVNKMLKLLPEDPDLRAVFMRI
jgi:hypothetical protein